jgi:hypothetical protein
LDENFHAALVCRGSWLLLIDIVAVILLNELSRSKTLGRQQEQLTIMTSKQQIVK